MTEKYRKAFDKLVPKRSDDELLRAVLGKADNMERKKLNKKAIIVPVAAALTLTLGAVGVTAALNTEHLREVFGGNESITENIHNYVFEDSDEHVKITVEEYLSDGQCTYLTVHYQALDEEGRIWLNEEDFEEVGCIDRLAVHPKFKLSNDVFYAKSYGVQTMELEYLSNDTDKFFSVSFEANSRCYGTEMADFNYFLTDGEQRSTILNISDNVESKWLELKSEKSPSEFYIPKYLVVSDLSYAILGENTGAFKDNSIPGVYWSFTSLMTREEDKTDAVHDISFVFSDGSEYIPTGCSCLSSSTASEENRYTDIDIISGSFVRRKLDGNGNFKISFDDVDVDDIVGLKFGDVYYELSAE
ncbi:MAG: hypothetical protein IJD85_01375 [Oscillospiraceae bacterium]|nr:hypothetical protein [Oscillospiraceae bacterium]